MGAWPDLTEYHEAVQHPPKAFADPGLKAVTLELDRFGMPKPATGGNAVVYKANEPGGFLRFKKTWAIRCFLRPISDHAERYEAISKHLRNVHLPYDVNFQFLKRGIQIRSNWFPVVKMQWAKGDLLHSHIEKHLGYPFALEALRAKWRSEERRVGKSVDIGGRRILKKKKRNSIKVLEDVITHSSICTKNETS